MGTDNPVTPHSSALDEIALLAEVGLGAVGALRAATINAAQLLRLPDRGEIAVGKRADLVLLDGDDLDVSNLAGRIKAVWHNGKRFR
jgi:imidazolonepropionase-like amidohydrolase